MKPTDKPVEWNHRTMEQRIVCCQVMLHLHGFVSGAENSRIKKRIQKWLEAAEAAGEEKR